MVLARGERIERIVDKTDHMASSSITFKKTSTSLKRSMYFKNIKLWIVIGVSLLILAYIIAAIVCKSPIFKGCWKKSNEPSPPVSAPKGLSFDVIIESSLSIYKRLKNI